MLMMCTLSAFGGGREKYGIESYPVAGTISYHPESALTHYFSFLFLSFMSSWPRHCENKTHGRRVDNRSARELWVHCYLKGKVAVTMAAWPWALGFDFKKMKSFSLLHLCLQPSRCSFSLLCSISWNVATGRGFKDIKGDVIVKECNYLVAGSLILFIFGLWGSAKALWRDFALLFASFLFTGATTTNKATHMTTILDR